MGVELTGVLEILLYVYSAMTSNEAKALLDHEKLRIYNAVKETSSITSMLTNPQRMPYSLTFSSILLIRSLRSAIQKKARTGMFSQAPPFATRLIGTVLCAFFIRGEYQNSVLRESQMIHPTIIMPHYGIALHRKLKRTPLIQEMTLLDETDTLAQQYPSSLLETEPHRPLCFAIFES